MARGDQRERSRAKAAAKTAEQTKGKRKDGLDANKRKEHDAEIMRQKQAAAAAKKGEAAPAK